MKNNRTQNKSIRDFSAEMLPHDHKALFIDCLQQRFDVICKCALVLLIFFIPLLIVLFIANLAYSNMYELGANSTTLLAFYQLVTAIKIPCYSLVGLGFAAMSRILRQLAWGEPIIFSYHLKMGMRQNGKRFVLIFTIAGMIGLLCSFSGFLGNSFLTYLPGLFSITLLLPVGLFMLSQAVIYDVTLFKSFSNGFALCLKYFFPTLGFAGLSCLVGCIDLIPILLIRVALYLLSMVYLSILALGWFIFSCHIFDKTINLRFPNLIGKGLYHSDSFTED